MSSFDYSAIAALLGGIIPGSPSKFTQRYLDGVVARCNRRIGVLQDRIDGVVEGRVMPDRDDVTIGSGRQFNLAILFLDICGFSSRPNWTGDEQKAVLKTMNMFMAEMLSVVHDFGGTYEKNTGDGFMAYFGETGGTVSERIKPAAEAALVMHYINDVYLSPWFSNNGIAPIKFRIGIDSGPVTIARVGIHGEKSSLVAIGTSANIANKLMLRIPNGGICIGDEVKRNLPNNWGTTCRQCDEPSGFVYIQTQVPYVAWELNHRLKAPIA